MALQFVAHALQSCPLENLTFGQTGLIQALEQVFTADGLVTFDFDAGNRRAFNNGNNQYVAIATELDILEKTGLEQFASGLDQCALIRLRAHTEGQGTEYAASRNALQTGDPNIGDGEGLGVNFGDHQCGKHRR